MFSLRESARAIFFFVRNPIIENLKNVPFPRTLEPVKIGRNNGNSLQIKQLCIQKNFKRNFFYAPRCTFATPEPILEFEKRIENVLNVFTHDIYFSSLDENDFWLSKYKIIYILFIVKRNVLEYGRRRAKWAAHLFTFIKKMALLSIIFFFVFFGISEFRLYRRQRVCMLRGRDYRLTCVYTKSWTIPLSFYINIT